MMKKKKLLFSKGKFVFITNVRPVIKRRGFIVDHLKLSKYEKI